MIKYLLIVLATVLSTSVLAGPLQTQYHNGGAEVSVLKAKIADGVLTVILRYDNMGGDKIRESYPLKEVYYIDPAVNKKYHVLKDENGKWIANPVNTDGRIGAVGHTWPFTVEEGKKKVVWFKFPAPTSSTTKVNLVVPNITPFDDLPVNR